MKPQAGHCHKAKYILIHSSRTYELRFAKILIQKLFYLSADLKNLYHKFLIFVRGRGEISMILSTFSYSNLVDLIKGKSFKTYFMDTRKQNKCMPNVYPKFGHQTLMFVGIQLKWSSNITYIYIMHKRKLESIKTVYFILPLFFYYSSFSSTIYQYTW